PRACVLGRDQAQGVAAAAKRLGDLAALASCLWSPRCLAEDDASREVVAGLLPYFVVKADG
ncbi:hypothetical protein L0668_20585, partial [Paraglaciecola aquimarina]